MADTNKFDNPGASGNAYGEMIKNPKDGSAHNSMTPVNAAAWPSAPVQVIKTAGAPESGKAWSNPSA